MHTHRSQHLALSLLLITLFCLLMPSCHVYDWTVAFRHGTSALQMARVEATSNSYLAHPPSTVAEMTALMGTAPLGTHSNEKGDYAYWECYETMTDKTGMMCSWAGCLSKNGNIISSSIKHPKPYSYSAPIVTLGDKNLFEDSIHPGMLQAQRMAWKSRWYNEAYYKGKEVAISPSGDSAHFLTQGSKVTGWHGDTPILTYTAAPAPAPVASPKPDNSQIVAQAFQTFANNLGTSLATPTPTAPAPASNSNPEWLQQLKRRNQQIYDDAAATKQRIMEERARSSAPRFAS